MPIIEGFLCKQGSGRGLFEFKTWKVRWCVIDYGHIKFYNSESQESELRKYSLSGAQLSSNVDAAEHDAPYECVFVIHFSSESQNLGSPPVVVLCVESLEEMQCWIDAIKIADASTQTTKITIDEPSTWLTNEEIQNLASMLSVDNFSPVFSFARIVNPSQLGPFFDHTSMILLHFSNMPHFIDICIDQLMSGQVLSTLFRENTVDLRFIAKYMFLVGKDFLKKVVEPHIHAAVQHPSLEVNPLKIQIEDSAASRSDEEKSMIQQSHCKNHHSKIMTITSALLASIDSAELPYSIVKVLHRIAVLVSRDFPDFMYAGVCNVFFLRFIVASLCTPHMFGLCTDIEFTPSQTRNLSIIAKVVQNIANGIVENKKEPFMQPLSSFIAEKQIFMAKFVSKVMGAGSSLSCDQAAKSLQSSTSTLCSLSKMNMQDLQLSSNWWIQFIHTHSTELPPALQMSISQSEFGCSSMRDSIRGQLANWSLIMEGKTVFSRPVLMSSLKPTIFSGDAFVVARFDCWCKLNRALMHGTLYATRSAFIFIACVFDSFDEIVVMQFTKIERITKLNIVDVEALVELDLNRPFFLDIQSAIRIDLNTDSGSVPVILFGITVGSDVAAPVDGTIDSSGKKSPSIFAAMYSLLSLSKARQEAASTSLSSDLPSTSTFRRVNSTSSSTSAAILSKSTAKSFIKRNSLTVAQQAIPQLQSLLDMLKAPHDEASAKGLSSGERIRLGSCRVHAQSLMHHINAQRNCYEINFTGTRVPARDPPILTRADWDAISPFIWYPSFSSPASMFYNLVVPELWPQISFLIHVMSVS
jgi:hypothetical protein